MRETVRGSCPIEGVAGSASGVTTSVILVAEISGEKGCLGFEQIEAGVIPDDVISAFYFNAKAPL